MMATATKSKASKGAKVEAKAQPQKAAPTLNLESMDESALLEALAKKREGKKATIMAEIEKIQERIAAATVSLREELAAKQAELRAIGGTVRGTNGGSINAKGATALAIFKALSGGPQTVKAMKAVPEVAAVMEGKYEKSFMAVALAALRTKGLVEQTANRGEWRLTAEGMKAAEGATAVA